MDETETPSGAASFIALQSADEVPLDPQIAGGFLLLESLLNPILSDILEPRCHSGSDRFRTMRLGDANNPDIVAPASCRLAPGHSVAHDGQPVRQAWEIHNLLIYKRIVGY
jgi:hypothetical protein